jgi:hypothetical protein
MRRVLNGVIFAGAACALIGLSGCASIESVEHAQATADQALADAGRAQQTASNAQAAAERAQQTASAAQSSADRVAASVTQSRSEYTALNQQVESMRPRRGMRD